MSRPLPVAVEVQFSRRVLRSPAVMAEYRALMQSSDPRYTPCGAMTTAIATVRARRKAKEQRDGT